MSNPNVYYTTENNRCILHRRDLKRFSLKELNTMPTITQGHFDDLKFKDKDFQVWLSRCTIADGMPYNNQVTVEIWNTTTCLWQETNKYQAK